MNSTIEDTGRRIIHVDMDAFFASVEQRDNPALRGRPVAVGRGQARGVVAAASYEARRFGVRSAMPSITAMKKCPTLIFTPPRFEVYRSVSAQIHEVFRRHTQIIEPLSLDEAYLDVSEAWARGVPATEIAKDIRSRIREVTGLTASAGVSINKFTAKLASDQNKPDGLTVIRPSQIENYVASLPVGRFHGVGPVIEARMKELGLATGADLQALGIHDLRKAFGSSAEHYWRICRGIDDRPVQAHRERKSIGAEETFEIDLRDVEQGRQELGPIAEKVSGRAQEKAMLGHTVTLKVKFSDFEQITRQRTLSRPVRDTEAILAVARQLIEELDPLPKTVRLLGISLSSLVEEDAPELQQMDLFEP